MPHSVPEAPISLTASGCMFFSVPPNTEFRF